MHRFSACLCVLVIAAWAPAQQPKRARPAITGISHTTFFADDLEKSRHFYTAIVGWKQVPTGEAPSSVRIYADHAQYIELISSPSKGLADRLVSIGFSTSDAESMRRFLAANGVAVPATVSVDHQGDRFFKVHD